MRALRSSLGLLVAGVAMAQAPPETASVAGTVTNSITGAPLVRAHVALRTFGRDAKNYGALSTPDGSFSITGITPGTYQATVDQVGFFMPAETNGRQSVEVVLRGGDKKEDLKMRLAPLGSISGRVVNAEGEPIESARVIVDTGSGMNSSGWDVTDDKGRFKLVGVRPGRYRVKADSPTAMLPTRPEIRTDGTVEVHYAPTYYGGSTEFRTATRVEVKAGAEVNGVEIALVRAPMVRISGRVIGAPQEIRSVSFMFSQRNSSRSFGPGMKKDGTFELWNIEPGKFSLTATWMNGGQRVQTAPIEVEIGQTNIDNIELREIPPADIAGVVAFEDDEARPQSKTQKQTERRPNTGVPAATVRLQTVDPGVYSEPVQSDVSVEGAFHLTGVRAARYRVMLSWPWAYVKSITAGSTEVDGNVLNVRNGAGTAITVHVSSAFGSISGTVSDASGPVAGAQVALVRDDFVAVGDANFTPTDASGSYTFGNVRPGGYRIAAVDDNDGTVRSGNLDDYEDIVAHIDVQPKDKLTKDLKRHAPVK